LLNGYFIAAAPNQGDPQPVEALFTPIAGSFPSATPEPTSIILFGTDLLGMALVIRESLMA
jgi:hypothetical protein